MRLAYARRANEYRRQCVFMGSTNEEEYLVDRTGNRRWWPVRVETDEIDTDALAREMPQIVAEARQWYLEMRKAQPEGDLPLFLADARAKRIADDLAGTRVQEDESDWIAEKAEAWLLQPLSSSKFDGSEQDFNEVVTVNMIWHEACGQDRQPSKMDRKHVGQALRSIGWGPVGHAIRLNGAVVKGFRPVDRRGNPITFDFWRETRMKMAGVTDSPIDDPLI